MAMTPQEVIMKFNQELSLSTKTGKEAVSEAIRAISNFSGLDDLKSKMLDDIRTANNAEEFLENYCDIFRFNDDTGAITGSDAGNGIVKTEKSVVKESTKVSDWQYVAPGSTEYLSNGMKVILPATRSDGASFNENELFLLKGIPHWLEAAIELNKESYGLDFSGTACDTINVTLTYSKNDNWLARMFSKWNGFGKAYEVGLEINLYYYSNLDQSEESAKDLSSGQGYLDRTIAHEMTHSLMAVHFTYAYELPAYITEGAAELVHGVDKFRSAIPILAANADLMSQALNSENWTDYPVVNYNGKNLNAPCYAGGYVLLRYLAKQASTTYKKDFVGTDEDDNFETRHDDVTIYSGNGNDTLKATGENLYLNGGSGNDSILLYNNAKNSTIIGGADNDTISLQSATQNLILYTTGDGSDLVTNIGTTDTVSILGEYTPSIVGNDYLLIVGIDTITVSNGANTAFTILNENPAVGVTLENTLSNILLSGTEYDDSLSNKGNFVTILSSNGDDSIYNEGDSVTIDGGAGSNVINLNGINEVVKVGDGANTINAFSAFTVENFGADDVIDLGTTIEKFETVEGGIAANDIIISGISSVATVKNSWNTSTNSIDYSQETTAGAKFDGTKIIYDATNSSEKFFTITGINSSAGVSLEDKVVTVSKAALKEGDVSINNGYTLALGSDVTKTSTTNANWTLKGTTASYKAAATSAGYKLADNQISYVKASGGETLITVSGVKSLNGISLEDKVVTVSKAALDKNNISISDGYTLALGNDVTKTSTTNANWTLKGTTASYKAAAASAGYKLADNQISYVKASGGETLITVSGVKSLNGISLNGKIVTVAASSLNAKKVTVSKGYTLALADDVAMTSKKKAWSLDKTTATYKQTTTAGYKVAKDSKSISYTKKSSKTLVTVSGVKSLKGISLEDKVVTVSKAALNKAKVSISKGYTLALSSDVDTTKENISKWTTLKNGNVAYLKGGTGAYYSLNKAKTAVTYTAAKSGKNQVELSGVKGTPTLKSGVVSLTASNFKKNVSVESNAGGYSFSLSGNFKNKTFTGSANADTITSSGSNIAIKGGKGNDSLIGGKNNDSLYGGKGKDSLWGGAGNDTLFGDAGNDTFIYQAGQGKDVIADYAAGDMLKILKTNGKEGGSFTKAKFSSGNLTLTIKGGGTVIFDGVTKGDKFNINGKNYTIKGTTLR